MQPRAANIADANGWTSAAWPSTDDDKAQVLDGFLKAAGARYAEIAGQIAFIHRAAPRAPVFTVRARDTAGPVEIDTASSKLNRFNTVRPRFWSENNEWEMTALPEVTSTEWQIEDGQGVAVKRTRGADYTFVVDPKQTRELASLEISNSREGIRGRVPLRPYMDPEPGNTFIFDEPDFALSNLKCFVLDVEDDTENDTVVVTFETETDGKYPYAYGQTGNPPPAQELDPRNPFHVDAPLPGDWTITPRPPAPGGGQLPGFDLGGGVSNDTATAIIVETGPSAIGPWTQAYQGPPTVTNIPIDGLQPGSVYYVAVQYQRNQNYSARYVYGPYTAPALDPGPNAPTILQQRADIDALADLQASETVLRQQQVDQLRLVQRPRTNLDRNSTGIQGTSGWTNNGLFTAQTDGNGGPRLLFTATSGTHVAIQTVAFAAVPNAPYTISGDPLFFATGGNLWADIQWEAANGALIGYSPRIGGPSGFNFPGRLEKTVTAPANAARGRKRIFIEAATGVTAAGWRYLKTELGAAPASLWSDDAAEVNLWAETSITKTNVLDLASQNALARLTLVAAASGGIPARIGLTSSTLGSAITFDAPYIYWGANTVFEDATDTLVTVVGDRVRVMAFGAPFGANGNLLEWWGPSGTALGAMTTANGLNGRMTTAPYVFDNVVASGGGGARLTDTSVTTNNATNGATWVTWGTVSFSAMPAGGKVRPYVSVVGLGATFSGGGSFEGAWRLIQNGTVLASGGFSGTTADGVDLQVPNSPLAPAQTGATTIALQVQRASGVTNITGGVDVNFYADWTANA